MPTWRTELPPEGKNQGFDLRRTPASGTLAGIITCEDMVVCDTHYWHGRTAPCERETNEHGKTIADSGCPACLEKAAWRTHVYVSAFDPKRREHFLFECTAMAAKPLQEYRAANGTLRGCIIHAQRPKGLKNAKVAIDTTAANMAKCPIPPAPSIPDALAVIWRLPRKAIAEEPERYSANRLKAISERLNAMRDQPDNAIDPPTIGEIINSNGKSKKEKATT